MIPSLRVSVWSACNLSCSYCHKEGNPHPGRHLSDEEILQLILAALPAGVLKVKITGGEPLLRPKVIDLLAQIIRRRINVSLTTNGTRLSLWAQELREIKLKKVGVSLDTLHPDRLQRLCGVDAMTSILRGIYAARDVGLPLELNTVLMRGVNEDEWEELIGFAEKMHASLQFIELSPATQSEKFYECHHIGLDPIERVLQERGEVLESVHHPSDRARYRLYGVEVSLCRSTPKDSDGGIRRRGLRLSADGKVYGFDYRQSCLLDLGAAYRAGIRGNDLTQLWVQASSIHQISQN